MPGIEQYFNILHFFTIYSNMLIYQPETKSNHTVILS